MLQDPANLEQTFLFGLFNNAITMSSYAALNGADWYVING